MIGQTFILLAESWKKRTKILLILGLAFFLVSMIVFIFFGVSITFFEFLECGIEAHSLHLYIMSLGILLIGYILFLNDLFLKNYLMCSLDKKFGFLQKKRSIVR